MGKVLEEILPGPSETARIKTRDTWFWRFVIHLYDSHRDCVFKYRLQVLKSWTFQYATPTIHLSIGAYR